MLPIRMSQDLKNRLDVTIATASIVMILANLVMAIFTERVTGLSKRMRPPIKPCLAMLSSHRPCKQPYSGTCGMPRPMRIFRPLMTSLIVPLKGRLRRA